MATTTTTTGTEPKQKSTRKKLDLATAHVADGALAAPRSIADIIGGACWPYDTRDFGVYSNRLRGMQLYALQQHAQKLAIVPSHSREQMIKRLEEEFKKQRNRNSNISASAAEQAREGESDERREIRERAEAFMRGEKLPPLGAKR